MSHYDIANVAVARVIGNNRPRHYLENGLTVLIEYLADGSACCKPLERMGFCHEAYRQFVSLNDLEIIQP